MRAHELEARLRALPRDGAPDPARLLEDFTEQRRAELASANAAPRHGVVWTLLLAAVAVSGSYLPSSAPNDQATLGLTRLGTGIGTQLLQHLRTR